MQDIPSGLDRFVGEHAEETLAWLLNSDEPWAEWVTRTRILGEDPASDPARDARLRVVADPAVAGLIGSLPPWGGEDVSGHHSPAYLPNRLNLLADMGLRVGDSPVLDSRLEQLMEHQDREGRFLSLGRAPGRPKPEWGSLSCDTNVITDVLMRFGMASEPSVQRALGRILADAAKTPQGRAWQCIPESTSRWRGPGRKADVCPQVTLEGLRALSHLPAAKRPAWMIDSARTPLEVWRRRVDERPYMFGHGYQFKSVKWPNFWYDALWALETLGRFPELWHGPAAQESDRVALTEMLACLIAYNFDPDGRVTPRRTYKGFEGFSFGSKKGPSPFATALSLAALAPFSELAEETLAIDVTTLASSKGGSGTAVPPKRGNPPAVCPVPVAHLTVSPEQAMAHVLTRQHLASRWDAGSVESVTADLVGLHNASLTTPYVSLSARVDGFMKGQLDSALYDRRSLVRFRCMRGTVFTVRRELLPIIFAATSFPVIRFARRHAEFRGVTREVYEEMKPRILDALEGEPLPTALIRERLGTHVHGDVAAAINLMCAQGLLLRDRPVGAWQDRRATYVALEQALPEIRLDSVTEDDAVLSLVRSYVRGFGPVSVKDVSWWLAIGRQRVERALEQLEGEVVEVFIEGQPEPLLLHAADLDELSSASLSEEPHVVLLPTMDSLVMGYASRGRLIADEYAPFVFDQSRNMPATVLVNGRIAGVWDTTGPGVEPALLLHLFPGTDPDAARVAKAKAAETGAFWFDREVSVRMVESMIPLQDRPIGCVNRPLRP
ncbi:MAG: winged helix DNA-binding domain-containing protein [Actinobacteria bacterium]|nr:winged helix DNA-binding domain-containing protein [Actinomycetota bacterium]MCG2807545.1 winged helix DNA-binding domain-containing protein [Coriobacteriia bacterium]